MGNTGFLIMIRGLFTGKYNGKRLCEIAEIQWTKYSPRLIMDAPKFFHFFLSWWDEILFRWSDYINTVDKWEREIWLNRRWEGRRRWVVTARWGKCDQRTGQSPLTVPLLFKSLRMWLSERIKVTRETTVYLVWDARPLYILILGWVGSPTF